MFFFFGGGFEAKFLIFEFLWTAILENCEPTDSASKPIDRTDGCASQQFHFLEKAG